MHPLRVLAESRDLLGDGPVVLVDPNGNAVGGREGVDVVVFGLVTSYRNGRPAWMTMGGRRQPVTLAVPECVDRSCIVEARDERRSDAVPFDRVEVKDQYSVTLFLPDGVATRVDILDEGGDVLGRRGAVQTGARYQ